MEGTVACYTTGAAAAVAGKRLDVVVVGIEGGRQSLRSKWTLLVEKLLR